MSVPAKIVSLFELILKAEVLWPGIGGSGWATVLVLEMTGGFKANLWPVGEGGAWGRGDTNEFTAPRLIGTVGIGAPAIEVADGNAGVEIDVVLCTVVSWLLG